MPTKSKTQSAKALGETEFDYIVAADPGNGLNDVVSVRGDGTCYASANVANVRVQTDTTTLDSKEMKSFLRQTDVYKWEGREYIWGDDVTHFPKLNPERNMGNDRYGNDPYKFAVAASCLSMGVTGDIDLTLGLPPGLFNSHRDKLVSAFMGRTHYIEMQAKDGKVYSAVLNYKNVRVMPEGSGVVFCNRYFADGSLNEALVKYLTGQVGIIDFGKNTIDVWTMINGLFDAMQIRTFADYGMHHEIVEPLWKALEKIKSDYKYITFEDIDFAIRSGTFRVQAPNGESVGIEKMYRKLVAVYAERIITEIIQPFFRSLDGLNGLHLMGGGAKAVRQLLADRYPGKIFDKQAVGGVDETQINAVGWLRFVLHNYFWKE